jgi:hypothetical protein
LSSTARRIRRDRGVAILELPAGTFEIVVVKEGWLRQA